MDRLPQGFSATKVAVRSFEGGMDQDTDPKLVPQNKFKDSQGMTLKRDGENYALSIDRGPAFKQALDDDPTFANVHLLGTVRATYRITYPSSVADEECVTTFVYNSVDTLMTVYCYVPSTDVLYTMYSETVTLAEGERSVSQVVYRENDRDYIYFTNYSTPVKKMKCEITSATHSPYTANDLYLFRRALRGKVTSAVPSYTGTGYLKCGTYQFYVRAIDNTKNKYTKWSAPSTLVRIGMNHSTNEKSYGGLGYVSNASIACGLTLYDISPAYSTLFTHYQLAVVENIDGLESGTQVARILTPQPISDFTGTPGTATFTYNANTKAKEVVPISELTVDDTPIDVVKALGIKNNRMLLGKVRLKDLTYDNGEPAINKTTTTPLIVPKGLYDPYANPQAATEDVGYWRNEVYRFYVSYFDDHMNYSRPKAIDFSGATNNKATATCIDWKFPSRKNGKYGPLINSTDQVQILKLKLMGLQNHPKWAKGFVILRAVRKKNIQLQSPLVPSILVQPARAVGDYPDQPKDKDGTKLDVLNVSAADPQGSFVPKNFFHILPKSLIRFGDFYGTFSTDGKVYVDNLTADYVPYGLRTSLYGDFPIYPGETGAYKLVGSDPPGYTDDVTVWKVSAWPAMVKLVSGDLRTVYIYRRTIGTTPWGSPVQTYISYATPDVGSGYSMDLSLYDYKIVIDENV